MVVKLVFTIMVHQVISIAFRVIYVSGCAIKANVEKLWREHFVIEEDMLEISGTNITPDIVLRASV